MWWMVGDARPLRWRSVLVSSQCGNPFAFVQVGNLCIAKGVVDQELVWKISPRVQNIATISEVSGQNKRRGVRDQGLR